MKKLLILLFSMLVSLSSYGETYVCSGSHDEWPDDIMKMVYKRSGNSFLWNNPDYDGWYSVLDTHETNKSIFLTLDVTAISGFAVVIIDKKSKKFRWLTAKLTNDRPLPIFSYLGKCNLVY